jgi:hypothetical protein
VPAFTRGLTVASVGLIFAATVSIGQRTPAGWVSLAVVAAALAMIQLLKWNRWSSWPSPPSWAPARGGSAGVERLSPPAAPGTLP